MKCAKVTYKDGTVIETSINGTDESIKEYFAVGKVFNLGNAPVRGDGNYGDNLQAVVSCEVSESIFS